MNSLKNVIRILSVFIVIIAILFFIGNNNKETQKEVIVQKSFFDDLNKQVENASLLILDFIKNIDFNTLDNKKLRGNKSLFTRNKPKNQSKKMPQKISKKIKALKVLEQKKHINKIYSKDYDNKKIAFKNSKVLVRLLKELKFRLFIKTTDLKRGVYYIQINSKGECSNVIRYLLPLKSHIELENLPSNLINRFKLKNASITNIYLEIGQIENELKDNKGDIVTLSYNQDSELTFDNIFKGKQLK